MPERILVFEALLFCEPILISFFLRFLTDDEMVMLNSLCVCTCDDDLNSSIGCLLLCLKVVPRVLEIKEVSIFAKRHCVD